MGTPQIQVVVRFVGPLKSVLGRRETTISLKKGSVVADLRGALLQELGQRGQSLVDPETGSFRGHLVTLVNGRHIVGGADATLLQDGDEVTILPPISGGGFAS